MTRKNKPDVNRKAAAKFALENPEKTKVLGIKGISEDRLTQFQKLQSDLNLTAPELLYLLLDKYEGKE